MYLLHSQITDLKVNTQKHANPDGRLKSQLGENGKNTAISIKMQAF